MADQKKIVIIGGVAGGATAAARLRRLDEHARIILIERGADISFANCGLPYYIGEIIEKRESLFVTTPAAFNKRYNIDIRTKTEARRIDPVKKEVELYDSEKDATYIESYDKLILSPGASPIRPPIPGIEDPRIFTVRNIPDTDRIKKYIDEKKPTRAVVVGGGYIGLEMAENLHHAGLRVTICEKLEQVMMPLDFEMAALVHQHMRMRNIEFHLKDGISRFDTYPDHIEAVLESGKVIHTDMVIFSIGVRPEAELAKAAGLRLGETGGIWVDDYLRTSDEHIYAIGDAVEITHLVTKEKFLVRLAGPANKQGRIVADNIYDNKEKYEGSLGTGIVRVFDIVVGSTGANEKMLKKAGVPYRASLTHSPNHAGYYPGAVPVSIKLLFTPDEGKVLGAQVVGLDGVDKRVDVFATAIMSGATVADLEELDLAYAPPYGSAKDPVNIAGYVAHNILKNHVEAVYWSDVDRVCEDGKCFILDVRTPKECELGMIKGAVNIPVDELRNRLAEIPRDRRVLVYCQVGLRGYVAWRILKQHGFDARNLSGGYKTYEIVTGKQENDDVYEYDRITVSDEIIKVKPTAEEVKVKLDVDATGLQCPMPIIRLSEAIKDLKIGEAVKVTASDPGFLSDAPAWARQTGNELLEIKDEGGLYHATIVKRAYLTQAAMVPEGKTFIVSSDEIDKAIATFMLANTARSMGKDATLFFMFHGLNLIRNDLDFDAIHQATGELFRSLKPVPKSTGFKVSGLTKQETSAANVPRLEDLIKTAREGGVTFIACQMSLELMGLKIDDLLDGVHIGGISTYFDKANSANVNMFI